MAKSKNFCPPLYKPSANSIEGLPNTLEIFCEPPLMMEKPHWHAQVEVNFIFEGSVHYSMGHGDVRLKAGDMCMFWGGQPHQMDDVSSDVLYAGVHLPLVHFFRLRLPPGIPARLMQGAVLLTSATDAADRLNFGRWARYAEAADPVMVRIAVDELLLRLERVRFDPYALVPAIAGGDAEIAPDQRVSPVIIAICDFIAENFREDIDSADVAAAVGIHPKYAMTIFKKATGMTLNDYVNLLRLSYAQAQLMAEDANVLRVAMDSGFGSLSAFNKCFRRIAGISPRAFRRDMGASVSAPAWTL